MTKQTSEQNVSAALVETLMKQGKSLKEIGNIIGCTESFISHVRNKRRSFSLEHLLKLQESVRKPLALMLLDATEQGTYNKELQGLRDCVRDSINHFYKTNGSSTSDKHGSDDKKTRSHQFAESAKKHYSSFIVKKVKTHRVATAVKRGDKSKVG